MLWGGIVLPAAALRMVSHLLHGQSISGLMWDDMEDEHPSSTPVIATYRLYFMSFSAAITCLPDRKPSVWGLGNSRTVEKTSGNWKQLEVESGWVLHFCRAHSRRGSIATPDDGDAVLLWRRSLINKLLNLITGERASARQAHSYEAQMVEKADTTRPVRETCTYR